jgi:hypothetical protein
MKTARNSSNNPYVCKQPWLDEIFVQCGDSGIVLNSKSPENSYTTAFFEAFPKNPSCFLRGEGNTIEEAENQCWEKYQKVMVCNHEMERRDRTDGYAYCKHCSYSSTVFEPLTKCCKCKIPTAHSQDYKGKWYCKKHKRFKHKDPNPPRFFDDSYKRTPRKYKKQLKKAVTKKFRDEEIFGKVKYQMSVTGCKNFFCDHRVLRLLFRAQEIKLLEEYKNLNK